MDGYFNGTERHGALSLVTDGIHSRHGAVTSPCHLTVAEERSESSEMPSCQCNDSVQALPHREYQRVAATTQDNNSTLPTIADLICLALSETDFIGDLDPATLEASCATSIDLAALIWEERHNDTPVPLSLIQWARCALLLEAEAMLRDREAHAEAERLDAITAGDIDAATGCFIPYDTYRGA